MGVRFGLYCLARLFRFRIFFRIFFLLSTIGLGRSRSWLTLSLVLLWGRVLKLWLGLDAAADKCVDYEVGQPDRDNDYMHA